MALPLKITSSNVSIPLTGGQVYEVTDQTNLKGCTLFKAGAGTNGANPVIRYRGHDGTGAFTGNGSLIDIDGEIAPNCYLFNGTGKFTATRSHVHGGGGLAKGLGATITLIRCYQDAPTNDYSIYVSGCVLNMDGCILTHGSIFQSILRIHESLGCDIKNCTFDDRGYNKAAIRLHDSKPGSVNKLTNNHFFGPSNFCPLDAKGEDDLLPPGPKRDIANAKRLYGLIVDGCTFDGEFKIAVGGVDVKFSNGYIHDSGGGAVIDCPPKYMDRPVTTGEFANFTLTHGDGKSGRVFSDEAGASKLRVTGTSSFNGKGYTH